MAAFLTLEWLSFDHLPGFLPAFRQEDRRCVCVCVAVAAFQKEGSLPADSDTAGPLPLSAPVSRE